MQIVKEIYDAVVARDPEQPEFHQAELYRPTNLL